MIGLTDRMEFQVWESIFLPAKPDFAGVAVRSGGCFKQRHKTISRPKTKMLLKWDVIPFLFSYDLCPHIPTHKFEKIAIQTPTVMSLNCERF